MAESHYRLGHTSRGHRPSWLWASFMCEVGFALRRTRPKQIPEWRLVSFLAGLFAIFVAVSSPLDTYSETLLFMHMGQHFVLMSVAPPLIVLGSPFVPMLRGLPRPIVRWIGGPIFQSSLAHRVQELFSRLPFAWLAMNLTYVGWHIPKAYEFALSSENWHNFEHFCFFATSLLFWWPIVQPWPARRRLNSWMIIPYLLTSDVVNTGLSAFLCFSGPPALSELCHCRPALRARCIEGSDRCGGFHVGVRLSGVPRSRHLPDRSILGQ